MKQFYRWLQFAFWELFGGLPNAYVKQYFLSKAFKVNDFAAFIESGTHRGQMVSAMLKWAPRIYSIELSKSYALKAQNRFAGIDKVQIIMGDSGQELGKILEIVQGPCLIWLDAHYSGGDTARAEKDSPIVEELESILDSPFPHFVWIDDARCFRGCNGYPSLHQLKLMLRDKYMVEMKADAIRCYPTGF